MVEGTKLREISENLKILEEKMQALTTECPNQIEGRIQLVIEEYNTKIGVLARRLDEIQQENWVSA